MSPMDDGFDALNPAASRINPCSEARAAATLTAIPDAIESYGLTSFGHRGKVWASRINIYSAMDAFNEILNSSCM